MERHVDVLVVGGGLGGCAAAMAAAGRGRRVVLTEKTDWVGGQATSQAVPPDEHPWIEQFGCTGRYRRWRGLIRQYYRDHYPLLPSARANPQLNPGAGNVSRICCEPRVALAALEQMLSPHRSAGRLEVLLNRRPVAVHVRGDRVTGVDLGDSRTGETETITADYVLDATELGELLPLAKAEYVVGAEGRARTGEPHAPEGPDQPGNVQAITWCFPMAYDPVGEHVIDRPAQYERWRDYVPDLRPAWPGRLLSWSQTHPISLEPMHRVLLPEEQRPGRGALWLYRRITARQHYPEGFVGHEVTLVNWPQNDYWLASIIDEPADVVARRLVEARQLSLSLLYWMQTEAPRPDGGQGYPGLQLRPDLTGTPDGLAMYPYIRESRRIEALFTVTEQHVGTDAREGHPAEAFADSVGVGCYRIDLHPSTGGDNYIDVSSQPFQIPLGALVPVRLENLLAACKNLGVTHITNGCYRLHPVEWNIGEAAGLLAAHCLEHNVPPRAVREDPGRLEEFQRMLRAEAIELEWPTLHPV